MVVVDNEVVVDASYVAIVGGNVAVMLGILGCRTEGWGMG